MNLIKNKLKNDVEQYYVSVSLLITTSKGKEMAKRIFSNLIKNDPNHPILKIKVKNADSSRTKG